MKAFQQRAIEIFTLSRDNWQLIETDQSTLAALLKQLC